MSHNFFPCLQEIYPVYAKMVTQPRYWSKGRQNLRMHYSCDLLKIGGGKKVTLL